MKQTIYHGGPIVTMTCAAPPAAVLVTDDRITALGTRAAMEAMAPGAVCIDLAGAALLPAFIDPHSHFSNVASSLLQLRLDGATSFADMEARLRAYILQNKLAPGAWVTASGYDHNRLAEQHHPDKTLLDAAAPDNPVVLQHASGHVGVLNSAALKALGITAGTPVPEGGKIALGPAGAPTGYMEEGAFVACIKRVPGPTLDAMLGAFQQAQDIYAAHGIATVQEGLMAAQMIPMYQALVKSGLLKLDVVGYCEPEAAEEYRAAFPASIRRYEGHFKLGGYKIFLDGSPQARTAWMTRPYLGTEPGEELDSPDSGYCGRATLSDEAVEAAVAKAAHDGVQILAHCNGDAAAGQYIAACKAVAVREPRLPEIRPVMIHAQLVRADQLDEMPALGMIPSFFVAHVYHWGDIHLRNFGPERASRISPAGDALDRSIPFTFHQDSPVIQPDMLETLWCAVNRITRGGVLLGPEERVSTLAALQAVTVNAAHQYFEENEKGALSPGMKADLVILNRDPLNTDPRELNRLKVLATIKNGEVIYHA